MATSRRRRRVERARHFFRAVALDDVADLDVVEVLDADTALESFADFARVVLEAFERRDRAVEHFDAVANEANASLTVDHAAANRATGDGADTRDLEDLAHLCLALHDLALFGAQHAFHRSADIGHRLVDDAVQLDVHTFTL